MYVLRSTIKCPNSMEEEILSAIKALNIKDPVVEKVPFDRFVRESRLYWDYVFPEMLSDEKPVTYISFDFPDSDEGREASHNAEWHIGWIPQNIRYVEV